MNYFNSLKNHNFAHWLSRVILFVLIWIGFIYLTSNYYISKDSEGAGYWLVYGLFATLLVLPLYVAADYIAKKRKWDNKSLWYLWISAIITVLVTSYFWILVTSFILFAGFIVFPIYIIIFTVIIRSIKFK